MGKIALTTLRVLNDRVYHYTAWKYEVSGESKYMSLYTCQGLFSRGYLVQWNHVKPAYRIILKIIFDIFSFKT